MSSGRFQMHVLKETPERLAVIIMRIKYSTILFLTILAGCTSRQVDYSPFDKLDLEKKCAVYFIRSEGDIGDFENANQDFVLTDKTALHKLKKHWRLTKTDKRMSCGFGYLVFITQDNTLVEEIKINEPCGYATTTGGWYDFDETYYDFIDISKIKAVTRAELDSVQGHLSAAKRNKNR